MFTPVAGHMVDGELANRVIQALGRHRTPSADTPLPQRAGASPVRDRTVLRQLLFGAHRRTPLNRRASRWRVRRACTDGRGDLL
jgi:hypothetical protein